MDKAEVAAILEEIALLLELQGENPFRANAYAKAGRTIAQLEQNIAEVVAAGTLADIPGIGETLRDKITLLVTTGKLPFYDDLKAKTPPGWLHMLRLPGMGPKKVKMLSDQLGIDDLVKLKAGCDDGSVAKLKGFGEKTQKNILEGLAMLEQMGSRVRIDQALGIADHLVAAVRKVPGIHRLELCGSLRRRRETIKDIDILVAADNAAPIMKAFVELPIVKKVIGHGETKSSIMVEISDHHATTLINATSPARRSTTSACASVPSITASSSTNTIWPAARRRSSKRRTSTRRSTSTTFNRRCARIPAKSTRPPTMRCRS